MDALPVIDPDSSVLGGKLYPGSRHPPIDPTGQPEISGDGLGALAILLPFGLPRVWHQRQLLFQHWKMLALMSIPAIVIFNTFIYNALQTTTAINTTLVNAMIPVFIALNAWIVFGEKLKLRQIGGVLVSFLGLVFIVTRGELALLTNTDPFTGRSVDAGRQFRMGRLFSDAAQTPQSDGSHCVSHHAHWIRPGFLSFPWYLWELRHVGGFDLTTETIASMAYVALFPSVLSFIFWNSGVQQVGANRAGIFIHLMPAFSIVLAIVFLAERLKFFHLAGIALIFSGIVLTTWPASAKDSNARHPVAAGLKKPGPPLRLMVAYAQVARYNSCETMSLTSGLL